MQCKCGAEVPESAKFCQECGKRVPKPKTKIPKVADELVIRQVEPILTIKEAAQLLRVSEWMMYELIRQNKIPYFTIGNRKRFRTTTLLEWAGEQEVITTAEQVVMWRGRPKGGREPAGRDAVSK